MGSRGPIIFGWRGAIASRARLLAGWRRPLLLQAAARSRPMTSLVAATCRLALLDLCGTATSPGSCAVCCGRHQHELRVAGCSATDCSAHCGSWAPDSAGPRPLNGRHFVGYNVVNLQSGNFSTDPAYVASTVALTPGTLRYPGGNLADWWDWRTGWCLGNLSVPSSPQATNPCYAGHTSRPKPRRPYQIEEFINALNAR